jgi:hypothetical protein
MAPPSRFYTDAVKAVERECMKDPAAASKCATLKSKWERILCEGKCRPRPSVDDVDAGEEPEADEPTRPGSETLIPH